MLSQMDDFFELFMMAAEWTKLDGFADISDSRLDTRLVVFRLTNWSSTRLRMSNCEEKGPTWI